MTSKNFVFTRLWIVFSSVFGILGVVILGSAYFYYLNKYNNGGSLSINNNVIEKNISIFLMKSYGDIGSYKLLFLIIIMFTIFTTIICNIGLIRYAIKSSDEELCANKWSLAILSLSLGGFLTPFALTWLPDANVKATKNARVTIVRYLGTSWLLSSLFSLVAVLVSFFGIIEDKDWTTFYTNKIVKIVNDNQTKQIFNAVIIVLTLLTVLNLIFVPWFYSKSTVSNMIANTSKGKWYRFVSTLYTVIVTFLLIIQIITSFLKLIEAFKRLFNNQGGFFGGLISFFNLSITLMNTFFMIYLIITVIKGLWRKYDNYMINIPQYRVNCKQVQY